MTPLLDGFVLRKGVQKSNLAGNYISSQIRLQFSQMTPSVPLVPHYMVKSKQPVDAGASSNATYMQFATPPTESYRKLEEERVLTSFKESIVQVWPGPGKLDGASGQIPGQTNADAVKTLPPKPFEMPDGWNQVFGLERFRVVEGLFSPQGALSDAENPVPDAKHTIPAMVQAALNAVDVETRPLLLNNVVLTGGGSLVEKLAERVQAELSALYPNPRVRVHTTSSATDRKYGAWIGGSVLASLGTFHQVRIRLLLWVMLDVAANGLRRCGSRRRSTKSMDLALSRRDASHERSSRIGYVSILYRCTAVAPLQTIRSGHSWKRKRLCRSKSRRLALGVVRLVSMHDTSRHGRAKMDKRIIIP